MSSLVLGTAGAFIGNMIAPGIGGQIGYALGSMVGGSLFQETQKFEGTRLNDLSIQANTNGLPITRGWGTFRTSGNVIWTSGYTEIKTTTEQGAKGGPTAEITNYTYTMNVAIAVHDGEISAIRRVWANKKLGADFSNNNTGSAGNLAKYMRVYKGTEFQQVDSLIQQYEGEYTPAFKGISYVIFENLPLEEYGNQIPQFEFEVVVGQLVSTDYNFVTIPNFNGTTGPIMQLYENTGDKHLYTFNTTYDGVYKSYIQKINQDTMSIVQENTIGDFWFKEYTNTPRRNYITNDVYGNMYSYRTSTSNQYAIIQRLDKNSLSNINYIYTDYSTEMQSLQTNRIESASNLYTKTDGITITMIGRLVSTGNITKLAVKEFSTINGVTSATSPMLELTKSSINSNLIGTYYKQNDAHYFISYIGDTSIPFSGIYKPILNIANKDFLFEDVLRLSDGTQSEYVFDVIIDNLRKKLYVFTNKDGISLNSQEIKIIQINLNNLSIENTLVLPNIGVNWYYTLYPVLNSSDNTIVLFQSNTNLGLVKYISIHCNNFTKNETEYNISTLNNIYPSYNIYIIRMTTIMLIINGTLS